MHDKIVWHHLGIISVLLDENCPPLSAEGNCVISGLLSHFLGAFAGSGLLFGCRIVLLFRIRCLFFLGGGLLCGAGGSSLSGGFLCGHFCVFLHRLRSGSIFRRLSRQDNLFLQNKAGAGRDI